MSIKKAFLLTLLITLIEYTIQAISFIAFDVIEISYHTEHLFGITIILCRIIAYATVFCFFWSKSFSNFRIKSSDFNLKDSDLPFYYDYRFKTPGRAILGF